MASTLIEREQKSKWVDRAFLRPSDDKTGHGVYPVTSLSLAEDMLVCCIILVLSAILCDVVMNRGSVGGRAVSPT